MTHHADSKLPLSPVLAEFPQSFVFDQMAGCDLAVTAEQVADFERYNQVGDPVADRLALWMIESRGEGRKLFEQALDHGIETVENAPVELVEFFAAVDAVPYWLDRDELNAGSQVASALPPWVFQPALIAGLCVSYLPFRSNQVLIRAGDLTRKAASRMVETTAWWVEVTEVGGMDRYGRGFKAAVRIRLTHAFIRHGMNETKTWDHEKWNLPVPQSIYVVTLFQFGMFALAAAAVLGVTPTAAERDAYLHLWRYIGFVVGVSPELIPAARGDFARLASVALHTEIDVTTPDPAAVKLTEALMDAVPLIYGVTGDSPAERVAAAALKRSHQEFTRLVVGEVAGKHLGLPPVSPLTAVTLGLSGVNFFANFFRHFVPGHEQIAAGFGTGLRNWWIKNASERTKADLTYDRDDSNYRHKRAS